MPAITVEHLVKTYRFHRKQPGLRGSIAGLFKRETLETRAVDDLSLKIEAGEVVGFLGPNGAGKTTTLKVLCGLLFPDGGLVDVLNHTPARREASYLRRIALVMGQKNMLWWDIPAMETLLLHRDMYRIPEAEFRRTLDELAGLLEVEHLLNVQVRKLSLGERMKMELVAALIHRPQVLFLDEPTIGLDVVSQARVRDFLGELNRTHGTTILLTSHYMDDITALCPRVLVIDHGKLHFDGALEALVSQAAPHKLPTAVFDTPPDLGRLTHTFEGVEQRPSDDARRVCLAAPRAAVAETANALLQLGRVVDLSIEEAPVEDIIRDMFQAGRNTSRLVPPVTLRRSEGPSQD